VTLDVASWLQWCADVEPEVGAAFVEAMRLVQLAGGEVVPVTLPELEHLRVAHLMTISCEMRQAMKPYTKVRASLAQGPYGSRCGSPTAEHRGLESLCSAAAWIPVWTRGTMHAKPSAMSVMNGGLAAGMLTLAMMGDRIRR